MAGESARSVIGRRRTKLEQLLAEGVAPARADSGGESVATILAALPTTEWRVFHDVRRPGRRHAVIDHVLVGPQGIFVVNTVAWTGQIDVDAEALLHHGRRRDKAVAGVAAAARAVGEIVLGTDAGFVKPVLCLVRSEPVFGWAGEVLVCSTGNVASLLGARAKVLDENEARDAAVLLSRGLQPAGGHGSVVLDELRRPSTRRRRSRKDPDAPPQLVRSLIATIALGLAGVLGFAMAYPKVADLMETTPADSVLTAEVGRAVSVAGNETRPDLQLTVDSVARTRALGARADDGRGGWLWAAHVQIRNLGEKAWHLDASTGFGILDESSTHHPRAVAVGRVSAGKALPVAFKIPPGVSRSGVVVFKAARHAKVQTVELTLGPGLPQTVQWTVDR